MVNIHTSRDDESTMDIIDWISYLDKSPKVTRINDQMEINDLTFHLTNNESSIKATYNDGRELNINKYSSFIYRRGTVSFVSEKIEKQSKYFHDLIINKSKLEGITTKYLLYDVVKRLKKGINSYSDNEINKLSNLLIASSLGLIIPETLVTNNITEFREFAIKFKKIITKSLNIGIIDFQLSNEYEGSLKLTTKIVSPDFPLLTTNNCIPSLFQEYIEKKIELRIFYLKGLFYSMAIFSQKNERTQIDYRNYDKQCPNRYIPYQLPRTIERKLQKFMTTANLNCGSIDMICTPKNEYIFLEVNPIGQYQFLERNCNYPISKEIALTSFS